MRSRGFTLLELLVAISIFSVLGLGSYQMLQSVRESHDRVRSSIDSYMRVSLALSIIQRDFNQFVPRRVRDGYGEPLPPMQFEDEDYLIEFTRGGWANPGGRPRSELQRVAYSIDYEEETLHRHFWLVLDRAEDSEPISQLLLKGVTDFRVTGYQGDDPEDHFSLDDPGDAVPLAVEVVIATDGLGEVQRLFQLTDPYFGKGNQESGPPNSNRDGEPDSLDLAREPGAPAGPQEPQR